jgi:phytoene desaturase
MKSVTGKSIIVVGAGIGGIASAARLARQGFQVSVIEKGPRPGGRASTIEQEGFYFDTGPTLFLMPEVFAETYAALGQRMQDHLELKRLDPAYRVHFHDETTLDLSPDLFLMRSQLDAIEPGAFENYLHFMSEGHKNYRLSLEHFIGRNFYSFFDYFNPSNLPLILKMKALVKHANRVAHFFKDPRLQAAFSFQNMYLGVSPYQAPATFSLLQYTEMGDGVWFPRGGMYRVIESLASIAEGLGVRFLYNSPVARINVQDNRTTGVTLEDGRRISADLVMANADLPYVYTSLLPQDDQAQADIERLARNKYTSSALMFYWGVQGERSPHLLHHNMFLADHRYKASFEAIFNSHTLPGEPSFYVAAPARSDPDLAPPDGDSLTVLVPVGNMDANHPQDWEQLQALARRTVIQRLEGIGVTNLEKRITFETSWGPAYYEKTLNLVKGSAFGLSHNFSQVGYLRPHNRHPRYRNLYFVGASTHPGTGLPIVLLSARLVVERILKEQVPAHNQSVQALQESLERV